MRRRDTRARSCLAAGVQIDRASTVGPATILDEARKGSWRILVGADAKALDAAVRADPEAAYHFA
jgi:hypothetical protein